MAKTHGKKKRQSVQSKPRKTGSSALPSNNGSGVLSNSVGFGASYSPADREADQIVGLVNLGHTCFFNAAIQVACVHDSAFRLYEAADLQVLLASPRFSQYYLEPSKRGRLGHGLHQVVEASLGKGSPAQSKSPKKKVTNGKKPFSPQVLHSAVLRIAPHLKLGQQQDSHELLRLLLDGLDNEELELKLENSGAWPASDTPHVKSFISQAFNAQLSSRIECTTCKFTSIKIEDFMDISVGIPAADNQHSAAAKDSGANNCEPDVKAAKPTTPDEGASLNPKLRRKQEKQARKSADRARKQSRDAAAELETLIEAAPENETGPELESPSPGVSEQEGTVLGDAFPSGRLGIPADAKLGQNATEEDTSRETSRDVGASAQHEALPKSDAEPIIVASKMAPRNSAELREPLAGSPEGRYNSLSHLAEDVSRAEQDTHTSSREQSHTEPCGAAETTGPEAEQGIEEDFASLWKQGRPQMAQQSNQANGCSEGQNGTFEEGSKEANGNAPQPDSSHQGGLQIEACLEAFFSAEEVMWECPQERNRPHNRDQLGSSQKMSRTVSFSDQEPVVRFVPGSAEQRGTDAAKALQGLDTFRRIFKLGEAYLRVTAEVDSISGNMIHLEVHPNDDTDATLEELDEPLCLPQVPITAVKDPDDEAEQEVVIQKALLLIDCIVDLVLREGVEGMQKMVGRGIWLKSQQQPESVCGNQPKARGKGTWEYTLSAVAEEGNETCSGQEPASPASTTNTPMRSSKGSFESIDLGSQAQDTELSNGQLETEDTGVDGNELGSRSSSGSVASETAQADDDPKPCGSPSLEDGGPVSGRASQKGEPVTAEQLGLPLRDEEALSEAPTPTRQLLRSGLKTRRRVAQKSYSYHRAPALLTLHLKRFQSDLSGRAKKITRAVAFGLELDISPWCDPQGPDRDGVKYSLVGVVVHKGNSLRSGHYFAYVCRPLAFEGKSSGGKKEAETEKSCEGAKCRQIHSGSGTEAPHWYYISDHHVKRVAVEEVLRSEAYVLLYERRGRRQVHEQ